MSAAARALSLALLLAGALFSLALGAVQLAWHYGIFAGRASFPIDLEWMEGGMLLHAARLAQGKTIYAPPSLEFIPFLYTPLYPALLAALSKIFPLGYLLGRVVSVVAFTGALGLAVVAAGREARARGTLALAVALALGVGAAGVVASGFAFTGSFYDLVRGDSLLLLLQAAALFAALVGEGAASAVLAGVLIALAFFTKQTASVVGLSIGVGLLVAGWRRGVLYGAAAAVTLGLGVLVLNHTSHGWFWTYTFKLHQSHGFNSHLAYVETPLRIARHAAPIFLALALATVGLFLGGQLRRRDVLVWAAALGGFVSSCVGFGTQWAFENAFIPAIYFPAFAVAVLGARLAAHALEHAKIGAAAFAALVCATVGVQAMNAGKPEARRWVPGAHDRAVAARFLQHLRALPGDVFIPFHPWYDVLAGKPTHTHRMGVLDVGALLGRPAGLDEALAAQKYAFVILDYKSRPGEWPTLEGRYHDIHRYQEGVDVVRSFSGADTSPLRLLAPDREPPPLPPRARRVADFESGWAGWVPQGDAFGPEPGPAPQGMWGRAAAVSDRFGPAATGALRSPPITIDRPHLRFHLSGPVDQGLRVLMLDGPEAAHAALPAGAATVIDWDVSALQGKSVTLLIEDRSPTAGLAVDEIVAY
jgi:hypothetical protein